MLELRVVPSDYELIVEGDVNHDFWPGKRTAEIGQIFLFVEVNKARTIPTGRKLKCVITGIGPSPVKFLESNNEMGLRRVVHWRRASAADEACDFTLEPIENAGVEMVAPSPRVVVKPRWIWSPPDYQG